mgnify:CR=1 FL=1
MSTGDATLRDEQLERTRTRIIDAAIALMGEGSLEELTVPLVADRAGVSLRTVYRHFPNKDALIEAVALLVDGRIGPFPFQETGDDVRALAPVLFDHFEDAIELMRAGYRSAGGRAILATTRAKRYASAEQALAPLLEGMTPEERRRAVGVIYGQHSTATYLYYRDTLKLSHDETVAAVGWVVDLLVGDLERQAAARARGKGAKAGAAKAGTGKATGKKKGKD